MEILLKDIPKAFLRVTTKQYADSFIENGTVRFGLPEEWINDGLKNGKGRGDPMEGVFAYLENSSNCISVFNINRPNCTILPQPPTKFSYYRSKDIISFRVFCLYALTKSQFDEVQNNQNKRFESIGKIEESYFTDFFPDVTIDKYDSLSDIEKPCMIIIQNPSAFIERLLNALLNLGIRRDECIIEPVKYIDIKNQFLLDIEYPRELLCKSKEFEQQNEFRIIINTKDKKKIKKLTKLNGIINLGDLRDIAYISEYYFSDVQMKLEGNTLLYELPKPIQTPITEEILISATSQLLFDEMPNSPMTIECMLQELRGYAIYFKDNFGLDLNVETFEIFDKNTLIKKFEGMDSYHFKIGLDYLNSEIYELAIERFSKSLFFNPQATDVYKYRAEALLRAGFSTEAKSDLEQYQLLKKLEG